MDLRDRVRRWLWGVETTFHPTAKQRFRIRRYLIRHTNPERVAQLDNAISFFVIFSTGLLLVLLFITKYLLEVSVLDTITMFVGLVDLVLSVLVWGSYKQAQFQRQIETRILLLSWMQVYLETLGVSAIIITTSVVVGIFTALLFGAVEGNCILGAVAIIAFLYGVYVVIRPNKDSKWIDLIVRKERKHSFLHRESGQLKHINSQQDLAVEIGSWFSKVAVSSWWTIFLLGINFYTVQGIYMGLLGMQISIMDILGSPVFLMVMLVLLPLATLSTFRNYNIAVWNALEILDKYDAT